MPVDTTLPWRASRAFNRGHSDAEYILPQEDDLL
jgi:hypothetical protein